MTEPSITCPKCKMVSYNLGDIEHKYCNNCHEWHEDMIYDKSGVDSGTQSKPNA